MYSGYCFILNFVRVHKDDKEDMEMADTIKVTLVKSPIGAVPKHKKTVKAMGLTKMHKTVEMPDNAATRGMIQQVQHLVKVED